MSPRKTRTQQGWKFGEASEGSTIALQKRGLSHLQKVRQRVCVRSLWPVYRAVKLKYIKFEFQRLSSVLFPLPCFYTVDLVWRMCNNQDYPRPPNVQAPQHVIKISAPRKLTTNL